MKRRTSETSRHEDGNVKQKSRFLAQASDAANKKRRKRSYIVAWCIILSVLLLLAVIAVPIYLKYARIAKKTVFPLRVSVSVLLRQNLQILSQTPSITIDEDDLGRGYVDIPAATRLSIANNDRNGCLLHFKKLDRPFEVTLIRGLGGEVQVGSTDAFIHQAYSRDTITRTLDYRFYLSDDARVGEYPWPLTIALNEVSPQ